MTSQNLCIVIPALNEQATIGSIVKGASKYGRVIVVDDGSTDLTGQLARENGAIVINNFVPLGYEAALNRGFEYASKHNFQWLITLDADGQHSYSDIYPILNHLLNGADIVTTVRDNLPRFSEKIFAITSKLLWGIQDPLSGFKGYNLKSRYFKGAFYKENYAGATLAIKIKKNGGVHYSEKIKINERNDNPRYGGVISANIKILKALMTLVFLKK
ncbi:MAG: glycosyltransferase family 2 protein [Porticoccaceae bacterium]